MPHLLRAASVAALLVACSTTNPSSEDPLADISDPQTLSQLLQWSLANQDLDALHKKAEAVRNAEGPPPPGVLSADGNVGDVSDDIHLDMGAALPSPSSADGPHVPVQRLTPERRAELEVLTAQMMPDVVGLMREDLASATDQSLAVDVREAALLDLEDHACDIDNARDLMSLGGFPSVVALMASEEPSLQAAAAWVIGSAVKNHHELQMHLLTLPNTLPSLLVLVRSSANVEVRAKALYALSALLRNCVEAQSAFARAGGAASLVAILEREAREAQPKLIRKALSLVTDLLREQGDRERQVAAPAAASSDSSVRVTVAVEGKAAAAVGGNGGGSAGGDAGNDGSVGDGSDASVALLFPHGRNVSELCNAVLRCFELDDLDAQEKAVLALEQLVDAKLLLSPAEEAAASVDGTTPAVGSGESGCALGAVRAALRRYHERCDRDKAAVGGGEPVGACDELEPTVRALDEQLEKAAR